MALARVWARSKLVYGQALLQTGDPDSVESAIGVLRSARDALSPDRDAEMWAHAQQQLAEAYDRRTGGNRADNLELAVTALRDAIGVLTPDRSPLPWAAVHNSLGAILLQRERGERAANVAAAISALRSALGVLDREHDPVRWALTASHLAGAYSERDERDLDRAIELLAAAVRLLAEHEHPAWVMRQRSLAILYRSRAAGRDLADLERAAGGFRAALAGVPREHAPADWAELRAQVAMTEENLFSAGAGTRYRAAAIDGFREALGALDPGRDRWLWARTQQSLGDALLASSRVLNLDEAIALSTAAIEALPRSGAGSSWGERSHNLGLVLSTRAEDTGDRDCAGAAIARLLDALEVRREDRQPEEWASTTLALARAYRLRAHDDGDFELARAALEDVQRVHDRERHPAEWADAEGELALVYSLRPGGDRAENLRRAAEHGAAALAQHARGAEDRARILTNQALTLLSGAEFDEALFEAAEQAARAAASLVTPEDQPERWALAMQLTAVVVLTALGAMRALMQRTPLAATHAPRVDEAIAMLERALGVLEPGLHARTTMRWLAIARAVRPGDDRPRELDRAARLLRATVEELDGDAERLATSQFALGLVLAAHPDRLRHGDALAALDAAASHLRIEAEPEIVRACELGRLALLVDDERENDARDAAERAVAASERVYVATLTESVRDFERTVNARLHETIASIELGATGRAAQAFAAVERGRSRRLRDRMAGHPLPRPEGVPAELFDEEQALLHDTRAARRVVAENTTQPARRREAFDALAAAQQALDGVWHRIESAGAREYVAARRASPAPWTDVAAWLRSQADAVAILEYALVDDELYAFAGRGGDAEPAVLRLGFSASAVEALHARVFREVHRSRAGALRPQTWQAEAARLLEPAMDRIDGAQTLCVVPHGRLHRIPLHAVEVGGGPLLERLDVTYAPSAAAAMRTVQPDAVPGRGDGTALVVGDALGDLPSARLEASAVARGLGVEAWLGPDATRDRVVAALGSCSLAYFAGHAVYEDGDPLASGIVLAGGEVLSARHLTNLERLPERLVISGCESATQRVDPGDELTGLASTLLFGGARSLVLSLWDVDDEAASEILRATRERMLEAGTSLAHALRMAALQRRRRHPHPHQWAPFVVVGDWR
jgi:CHAT domain-containing protein